MGTAVLTFVQTNLLHKEDGEKKMKKNETKKLAILSSVLLYVHGNHQAY